MGKSYRLRKVDPASKRLRKGALRPHRLPTTPIEPLEPRRLLSTSLLTDINPGPPRTIPSALTDVNGTLFFITEDGVQGPKLWKSDGTTAGTKPITTLGTAPSKQPFSLTNVNGTVFFANDIPDKGRELWKSDGTAAGTTLIKDINPTGDSSPANLTNLNGTLIFAANDGAHGVELWRSDGTPDGTFLLKNINSNGSSQPVPLAVVNGTLYFAAYEPQTGTELWKTDGTAAGTVLVKDICPGPSSSSPSDAAGIDGTFYFSAYEPQTGAELWKSDGTAAGTALVQDIVPGKGSSSPAYLTNCGGTLFFSVINIWLDRELWVLRGDAARCLLGAEYGADGSFPSGFTKAGHTILFTAGKEAYQHLWAVDETLAKKPYPIVNRDVSRISSSLVAVNDTVFFPATAQSHGTELWYASGSPLSMWQTLDIASGQESSSPTSLTAINGRLYFVAGSIAGGLEIWTISPATYQLTCITNLNGPLPDSNPTCFTDVNGTVFFRASDPVHGTELWKTDGTRAGTELVKDILPGSASAFPPNANQDQAVLDGKLFFSADDGIHGKELWMSDGTTAGTTMLKDIFPGAKGSEPTSFISFAGSIFFIANDGTHNPELWKTDGTAIGTVLLQDYATDRYGGGFHGFTIVDDTLFFLDDVNYLCKITATDTQITQLIYLGATVAFDSRYTLRFGVIKGRLLAAVQGSNSGIFVSDGTPEGTMRIGSIYPTSGFLDLGNGNDLYFWNNTDLWKTDGTSQGTVLVKKSQPGLSRRKTAVPFTLNGTRFFFVIDPYSTSPSVAVQKTNDIANGTVLAVTIPKPLNWAVLDNTLFFTTQLEDGSTELWRTDGTPIGTFPLRVLYTPRPAAPPFTPSLTVIGHTLYFPAYDPAHGIEPWTLTPSPTPPVASAGGPYTICAWGTTTLDASGSYDSDPMEMLTYEWDLNANGIFGETRSGYSDETGPKPSLACSTLWTQFVHPPTITLRVRNSAGQYSVSTATVNQLHLHGSPTGNAFTIRVNAATDTVEILQDTSGQMQLVYSMPRASFTWLPIGFGAITLTLDCSDGDPLASATLSVSTAGAKVRLQTLNGPPVVRVADLLIDTKSTLDLADTTLVVQPTPERRDAVLTKVSEYLRTARTSAADPWQGYGLTSSLAQANSRKGLAVIPNDRGDGSLLDPSLDPGALLIKCVWNGDVNLDGKVDLADYFRIDAGFITQKSGYAHGDLNYDGKINLADYFLVDSAFISQNAVLSGTRAPTPTAFPLPDSLRQAAPSEPAPLAVQSTQVRGLCLTQASPPATGLFATRPIASDRRLAAGRLFAGVFAEPTQLFELPG
ncbi:MAG TPA: ELWxxDGT repeat protein [Tepidisphaeraceae bacterium]|nr:ELWxxDGT repeat protein [Tepidisphaeraceae bacterium]